MERGKEVIRFKKEVKIKTQKVTQAEQSNHWRGIREDTPMKHQKLGLAVSNSDIVKLEKPFIPDKYKNSINLKKSRGYINLPKQSWNS